MAAVTAPSPQTPAPARDVYDVLQERGFVYQCSDEAGLRRALASGRVTFYCGFDPTADSLHIGNLVGIMAMAHLQRAGHEPVAVVGGGTTMIGDPTDRTASRRIMSRAEIDANAQVFKHQLSRFLELAPGHGFMVDNADWLLPLNYIAFLRDYGQHFSVNEMLRMETYRTRLESGLTFLEFNYALLQAYDFLELYRRYGCTLQIGGSDQWSNVLAGVHLIERVERAQAYALTWPLLTDPLGSKMGKSQATGQVWLDPQKTAPYAFYQHFVNVADEDVRRYLGLYTFLPMEEIRALTAEGGAALREAKRRLACEVTALAHGPEAARRAAAAARALFEGAPADSAAASAVPTAQVPRADLEAGIPADQLLHRTGLAESRGAARRLLAQGGAYLHDQRLGPQDVVTTAHLRDGALLLRHGKKHYLRVVPV
jgi:tyrosyl-tRNA synthetase